MESLRVLVVEDEAILHPVLQEALEEAGFGVAMVATAGEAIAALEAPGAAYAALVTDIGLDQSGPSGWDVARRARELNPAIPVVYMTAVAAEEWASSGVPGSILIGKPFAPIQAVTAVSQLLNTDTPP